MTEVISRSLNGFNSVFVSDSWQIATITYDSLYSKENFNHMKRHMTTDEVFTLLDGSALLHTVEDGKCIDTNIEKGKIYCVHKGTWHYLEVSPNAFLMVVENKDLSPEQSERMELECLLQK